MREPRQRMRHEFIGLYGMVERNWYLIKRYAWWEIAFFFWTAANTLTIVFIAKGVDADGREGRHRPADDDPADRRSHVVVPRDRLRAPDRDRRVGAVGGDDRVHVHGAADAGRAPARRSACSRSATGSCARRSSLFAIVACSSACTCRTRTSSAPFVLIAVASDLVRRHRDDDRRPAADLAREGRAVRLRRAGMMLVISGVYYPVSVLPEFMQWLSTISPATYALRGDPSRDPRRCQVSAASGATSGRC